MVWVKGGEDMDKNTQKVIHIVSFSLVVVGALNWGLVGLVNIIVVELILGSWPGLVRLVYALVGIAAVYIAITHMNDCKICSEKKV